MVPLQTSRSRIPINIDRSLSDFSIFKRKKPALLSRVAGNFAKIYTDFEKILVRVHGMQGIKSLRLFAQKFCATLPLAGLEVAGIFAQNSKRESRGALSSRKIKKVASSRSLEITQCFYARYNSRDIFYPRYFVTISYTSSSKQTLLNEITDKLKKERLKDLSLDQ